MRSWVLFILSGLFLIVLIIKTWTWIHTRNDRETRLFLLELVLESNPPLTNEEVKAKVEDWYSLVSGR